MKHKKCVNSPHLKKFADKVGDTGFNQFIATAVGLSVILLGHVALSTYSHIGGIMFTSSPVFVLQTAY